MLGSDPFLSMEKKVHNSKFKFQQDNYFSNLFSCMEIDLQEKDCQAKQSPNGLNGNEGKFVETNTYSGSTEDAYIKAPMFLLSSNQSNPKNQIEQSLLGSSKFSQSYHQKKTYKSSGKSSNKRSDLLVKQIVRIVRKHYGQLFKTFAAQSYSRLASITELNSLRKLVAEFFLKVIHISDQIEKLNDLSELTAIVGILLTFRPVWSAKLISQFDQAKFQLTAHLFDGFSFKRISVMKESELCRQIMLKYINENKGQIVKALTVNEQSEERA